MAELDVSLVVGLAFAVAASSFCPLLVLGIWWRGLTDARRGRRGARRRRRRGRRGAADRARRDRDRLDRPRCVKYPAAWTVPLAFAVMVGVSLATRRRVPGNVALTMLRLHAPDALRL